MIIIQTKFNNLKNAYVTYILRDDSGNVQYVGTCRLSRIIEIPDARKNQVFDTTKQITIEGVFVSDSVADCHNKRIELSKALNVAGGYSMGHYKVPITCRETGEVFNTLKDVVKVHGCTIAALCNHLQGKKMYNTVKGRTYYRAGGE